MRVRPVTSGAPVADVPRRGKKTEKKTVSPMRGEGGRAKKMVPSLILKTVPVFILIPQPAL